MNNHIFVECKFAIKLWSDLRHYCQRSSVIPILNPQSATFFEIDPDLGFWPWTNAGKISILDVVGILE